MNKKYKGLKKVYRLRKTSTIVVIWWNNIPIKGKNIRLWKKIHKNGYRNFI